MAKASAKGTTPAAPNPQPEPHDEAAQGNRPVHTIRYRNVKASIWLNESSNGPFYSVTLSRSWRDDAGNWHDAASFNNADLPTLAKAVNDCQSWIAWNERQSRPKPPGK